MLSSLVTTFCNTVLFGWIHIPCITTLEGAGILGFLCVIYFGISLIQYWAPVMTGVPTFSYVGGTSLLIVVGVVMETMQAMEAQVAMKGYDGFIKRRGDDSDNMLRGRAR